MKLSPEALSTLFSAKKNGPEADLNNRRHARASVTVRATIIRIRTNERLEVMIRDISPGGIGLTCDRELSSGEPLMIIVDSDESSAWPCTVKYCCRFEEGVYMAGAAFEPTEPA